MAHFMPDETDDAERSALRTADEATIEDARAAGAIHTNEEGEEILVLDCMEFRLSDIVTRGFSGNRWTDGIVYVAFDDNVSDLNKQRWREAARVWTRVAKLEFVESTGSGNYIHVQSDASNTSAVGMRGGKQIMRIANWDMKFVIAHEIGHALGLDHEQCRSDRDDYVVILTQNIIPGAERNFRKRSTTNYSEYDFCSIMHYEPRAFSKNRLPTIQAKQGYEEEGKCMGNLSYLSPLDAVAMAQRYGTP